MMTHTNEPLYLMNTQGALVPVTDWVAATESFIVHRSLIRPGWTVTHKASTMAVIQGLRTRAKAIQAAALFQPLSPNWDKILDRVSVKQVMNVRELTAMQKLHDELRASRLWCLP
jgi:hypothetical protein